MAFNRTVTVPHGAQQMDPDDGTPIAPPPPVACRNKNCRMFGQLVTPEPPRGVCPHCKTALPGSTLSRKTLPIDKWKVKQLTERYLSDYKPATQHLKTTCEQLAVVTERLEKVKPGSVEHQRLFAMWQQLVDRLESSRAAQPAQATDLDTLSDDQLIERTAKILRSLLERRDARIEASAPTDDNPGDERYIDEPTTTAPSSAPVCVYCHQSLTRCAEIKETRPDAWQALHWRDPTEIARRGQEATAEMYEAIGRTRRGEIPRW